MKTKIKVEAALTPPFPRYPGNYQNESIVEFQILERIVDGYHRTKCFSDACNAIMRIKKGPRLSAYCSELCFQQTNPIAAIYGENVVLRQQIGHIQQENQEIRAQYQQIRNENQQIRTENQQIRTENQNLLARLGQPLNGNRSGMSSTRLPGNSRLPRPIEGNGVGTNRLSPILPSSQHFPYDV